MIIRTNEINKELNWYPQINFEDGIRRTIKWYIENEFWWDKINKTKYNQERLGIKK